MTGQASTRRRKPYSQESIARALMHHDIAGVIETVRPPCVGTPKWRVTMKGHDPIEMSNAEAYAFCVGLAAGERHWKDRV